MIPGKGNHIADVREMVQQEHCPRCEGTGEIPVTEAVFNIYILNLQNIEVAHRERTGKPLDIFTRKLLPAYRRWHDTGMIPCKDCAR